jgi:hypothetical protein
MLKYTNTERMLALNKHRDTLHIDKHIAFTSITQHVTYKSIEELADIIIHYELFFDTYKEYNLFSANNQLYKKRKEIFFNENRLLTEAEEKIYIDEDNNYKSITSKL